MAFRNKLLRYLILITINFSLLYSKDFVRLCSSTLKELPDSIQFKINRIINDDDAKFSKIKKMISDNPNPKYFRHEFTFKKQKKIFFKNLIFLNMKYNYNHKNIRLKALAPQVKVFTYVDILIEKYVNAKNLFFISGGITYHNPVFFSVASYLNFLIIFYTNPNSNIVYSILYFGKKLVGLNMLIDFKKYAKISENFLIYYLMEKNLENYM